MRRGGTHCVFEDKHSESAYIAGMADSIYDKK
jgi:hypothetical protein